MWNVFSDREKILSLTFFASMFPSCRTFSFRYLGSDQFEERPKKRMNLEGREYWVSRFIAREQFKS